MKLNIYLIILVILISGIRCAKQTQPTGGPKDEIPPKLLESSPPNRQTNFKGNEIQLTFDEAIQTNNPREQIVITPSIGKKFELTNRKTKAILKLNSDLTENTTYTISFRESIQDLSEKNSAVNLKIAFSTGNLIDSLSISGIVYDLLEGEPKKNITVAAQRYSDTLDIFKHEAQWITLSNEKGEYSLENLKDGNYLIYAFDDKNKNLLVDSKNESYGFISSPVNLDTSITQLNIPLVRLDTRPLKLISSKPLTSYFNIRFSKGILNYVIKPVDSTFITQSIIEDISTIKVFNTFPEIDSLQSRIIATDSINNTIDTVLFIKFDKRQTPKDKFTIRSEDVIFIQPKGTLSSAVSFSKPVRHFSTDSIFIQLDSANFIRFDTTDFKWNANRTHVSISKIVQKETDFTKTPVQPGRSRSSGERNTREEKTQDLNDTKIPVFNQLIFGKASFISIEQDTSAHLKLSIKTNTLENTGTLLVSTPANESTIIQLIKGNTIIRESKEPNPRFEYLEPADFKLRLIIDKNNNGIWDPGNFYKRTEPEAVIFYENEKKNKNVTIKANWEVGPLLITPLIRVDK